MTTVYGGSVYPASADSFLPRLVDNVDDVIADHVNTALEAIENIQAKLGVDGDPVLDLGGVSFDSAGKAANPGAPGEPTLWVDNSGGPGFLLKYTDDIAGTITIGSSVWDRTGTVLSPTTVGDTLEISAGTASVPGLGIVGDPDTGGYGVSANVFGISAGGIERARFSAIVQLDTSSRIDIGVDTGAIRGDADINIATGTNTGRTLTLGNLVAVDVNVNAADLTLAATTDITFDALGMTTPLTVNQVGDLDLSGFTATSIVGALNEIKLKLPMLSSSTTHNLTVTESGSTCVSLSGGTDPVNFVLPPAGSALQVWYRFYRASQNLRIAAQSGELIYMSSGQSSRYWNAPQAVNTVILVCNGVDWLVMEGSGTWEKDSASVKSDYYTFNTPDFVDRGTDFLFEKSGDITFDALGMTTPLPVNQVGDLDLSGFTATSIVGALNELKSSSSTSLDSAYNGGRAITVDAGAITMTTPDTSNHGVLEITQLDVTNDPYALKVTNSFDVSTGVGANIELSSPGGGSGIVTRDGTMYLAGYSTSVNTSVGVAVIGSAGFSAESFLGVNHTGSGNAQVTITAEHLGGSGDTGIEILATDSGGGGGDVLLELAASNAGAGAADLDMDAKTSIGIGTATSAALGDSTINLGTVANTGRAINIGGYTNTNVTLKSDTLLTLDCGTSIRLGDSCITQIGNVGSTSHSLGADDLFVSGELEVDGAVWIDGGIVNSGYHKLEDNISVRFGSSNDSTLQYSTVQTADAVLWGLSSDSNSILFVEDGDSGYDFAHSAQTNPTVFVHSANQSTTEWLSAAHNQTNGVIDCGTGVVLVKQRKEVFIPIEWAQAGSSPPEAAGDIISGNGTLVGRGFSGSSVEDLTIPWIVPDDIDATAGITYQVHGVITAATAPASGEGVVFKMSGYSVGLGDSINGTFGTEVESEDTDLFASGCTTQYDAFVTGESGTVTVTNLAKNEKAFLHLERDTADADDDYVQDVGVMGITIFYTSRTA
jgi:hypothetical protein